MGHIFPKVIRPKGNVIARLEFELTYYDVAHQYVSQAATGTFPEVNLYRVRKQNMDKFFSLICPIFRKMR